MTQWNNDRALKLYYSCHRLLAFVMYYNVGEMCELDHKHLMEEEAANILRLIQGIKDGE